MERRVGSVAEHVRQRDECIDLHCARTHLGAFDLSAAGVDIADNIAHIVLGDDNGDLHDGLHEHGSCLLHRILERHRTGDLERHFGGVDLVIRSIVKSDLDVNNVEACKNARLHCTLDTGLCRSDIFLRDSATDDLVDELITLLGVGLDA